MPIKHIVMWRVRGDDEATRAANAQRVKHEFESLAGRIPGLRQLEVGIDTSRIDYACDVVLLTEFDSAEALAGYARHPEHLRVRDALGDLRISRHQVDYAAPPITATDTPAAAPATTAEQPESLPETAP
jgi:heme-degrading monooxygenase HmoA